MYSINSLDFISGTCMKQVESTRGGIIKLVCGRSKRFCHKKLLRELNKDNVKTHTMPLFNRIYSVT